jgi:penicillin G amidase
MILRRFTRPNEACLRRSICPALTLALLALVASPSFSQQKDTTRPKTTTRGAQAKPASSDTTRVRRAPARARIPEHTVQVTGLRRPVEVRRDRWGVPHIYAQTQEDLFLAQGFVAAQDRLFQMEMWRRQGEGRLAEVLGPSAVDRDRVARQLRYRGDMDREWAAYAPDAKEIVTSFVQGVNAYIAMAKDSLPIEFRLLGFRPAPWSVEVPLARVTGLSGTGNASSEVRRAQLVTLLGPERLERLFPTNPERRLDPAPGVDLTGIKPEALGNAGAALSDIAYARLEGSNNWVVSGARTVTGKPILANDPHRIITNPAVRYITHLVAPGWNVIGAGEPASPGVAIGHNDRIGFGLTVVGMDQQDLYVERLGACDSPRPTDSSLGGPPQKENTAAATDPPNQISARRGQITHRCYFHNGRWRPLQVIIDTIRVKGDAAHVVRMEFTAHGPIVAYDAGRSRAFALRGISHEPGTAAYLASLSLGRARNWAEFESAMARWHMPSENMIYADVDGNIGWIAGGLMPRRHWSGLLPVPGDGRYEWNGFVPPASLPRAHNPAEGFIATANHNIMPPGYRIPLSYEWASRYRIDRVLEALRESRVFSVDDFKRLQHDDYSKLAEALVPKLVAAARKLAQANRDEVKLLNTWNLRMSREQVAPLVFSAWAPAAYRRMATLLLRDKPDALPLVTGRTDYEALESWLASPPSAGPSPLSDAARDSALVLALDDATIELTKRFGADRRKWKWGQVHVAQFRHPLSSRYDLPPMSRAGDGNTVFATGGRDFRQTSGASYREIIDFADFDNSWATNVPGQSANPRSNHYGDLLELWGHDEYFPMVFSRKRVEQETASVLWLQPAAVRRTRPGTRPGPR